MLCEAYAYLGLLEVEDAVLAQLECTALSRLQVFFKVFISYMSNIAIKQLVKLSGAAMQRLDSFASHLVMTNKLIRDLSKWKY